MGTGEAPNPLWGFSLLG
jgi:hypothetical protein